jgi:hypothetical protein
MPSALFRGYFLRARQNELTLKYKNSSISPTDARNL